MACPTQSLPPELLTGIFCHLSPSHLAVASLVCHDWKSAASPCLYRTVYLCLTSHLEQFVQRISTEHQESDFSIINHLRGLVFDIKYQRDRSSEMIGEHDLSNFNTIISRLVNLNYLSWNLMFAPEDPETFRLFQTACPKLDSVHIWIMKINFYSDQYKTLFEFNNLSYFSLSIWDMPPGFNDHLIDPIASLLVRSPDLHSIILDLQGEFPFSPSALVTALGDQRVFPRLRRFHTHGRVKPKWFEFIKNPESHPFRQFLTRHPRIEDFGSGFVEEDLYYNYIDPAEMTQLFPLLKRFEGPVFLLRPLVFSSLAEQIERLIIVDTSLIDEVSLTEIYDRIPKLPRLRTFGIWAEEVEDGILVNLLRTIVNAADRLEEIEVHSGLDNDTREEVVELISQVRGLQSVTLSGSTLNPDAEEDGLEPGEELDWDAMILNLRCKCPRLRTIYGTVGKFDDGNRALVWDSFDDT